MTWLVASALTSPYEYSACLTIWILCLPHHMDTVLAPPYGYSAFLAIWIQCLPHHGYSVCLTMDMHISLWMHTAHCVNGAQLLVDTHTSPWTQNACPCKKKSPQTRCLRHCVYTQLIVDTHTSMWIQLSCTWRLFANPRHLTSGLPKDKWTPIFITFSARTTANMTQEQVCV